MLRSKFCTLELILPSVCEESTIFTIQLISNDSYKHFILHEKSVLIFFKSNVKFKSSVMSAPRMVAFVAPKLEKSFLSSLFNLKLFVVPWVLIKFTKVSSKSFLRSPFYRNPFELLLRHARERLKHLNRKLSVNVILNLLNRRVRSVILCSLGLCTLILGNRDLKPISDFKNVSWFQILIFFVRLSFFIALVGLLPKCF